MKHSSLRNKCIAAIHAAKRDLGMDDDTYRTMLATETGKRSAKDLSISEMNKVLDRCRKAGAKLKPRKQVAQHPGRPHNLETSMQLRKVEALLAELGTPWSYADGIARQQTGIAKVAWVNPRQLRAVIAALTVELEKRELLRQVNQQLRRMDISLECFEQTNKLKEGWQRNRATLRNILTKLTEA